MGAPEYHKIIDVMAESFSAVRPVEKIYGHDDAKKSDMIQVVMNTIGGEKIICRVYLNPKTLQLVFDRSQLSEKKFEKFISRFEYDLEQAFFRNIRFERDDTPNEYRLKIQQ